VGGAIGGVELPPDWLKVTVFPATVNVPVRAAPVFAATTKLTPPMPEPLAPLVIVIHVTLLTAVQEQLVPLDTESALVVPLVGTVKLVGVTVYTQLLAAWLNVTVTPPTMIVPVRGAVVLLAATL
jgi:hypothetical protein